MLTINAAVGFSTTFPARFCPFSPTTGGFAGTRTFGTTLLTIENAGPAAARSVVVTIASPTAETTLYGPTSHISIPAGGSIPIGVAFARRTTSVAAVTSTVMVRWLDDVVPATAAQTSTSSITCLVFGPTNTGQDTVFVPSQVQLVASGTNKEISAPLRCQRATSFTVPQPSPASVFSWSAPQPAPPATTFAAGAQAPFTLEFKPDPARQQTPQAVTVSAGPQKVPLICWVADTVLPGELSVIGFNADPPGPDLPNETVTLANVSNRTLDLTGCRLQDSDARQPSFPFPAGFTMTPPSASRSGRVLLAPVQVHSGRGQNTTTDLFWGSQRPIWNNDFDQAVVVNFAGDEVVRRPYTLPPLTGGTLAFSANVPVLKAVPFTGTGFFLEDGDVVTLIPAPASTIWTGDLLIGSVGPAGLTIAAPAGYPLPGAPMFALLADAGGVPILIGVSPFSEVVNRTSRLRAGSELRLFINDAAPGAFGTGGAYSCLVLVVRR